MSSKREACGRQGKPKIVVFIAPKKEIKHSVNKIITELKSRGWDILQIVEPGVMPQFDALINADFIVSFGGDGTLLYAAKNVENLRIPILGVNFGRIGFLTEVSPEEFLSHLDLFEEGKYHIKVCKRLGAYNLEMELISTALNEHVIITGKPGKVVSMDIYINDRYLGWFLADGLIIASSIGSSAYAFSAGGPLVSEDLDVMVLVAIAPVLRKMPSIVIPCDAKIKVRIREDSTRALLVSDGEIIKELNKGEVIIFTSSNRVTRLIRIRGAIERLNMALHLRS